MTMPDFRPNRRAAQARGALVRKKHRGGCPGDSGTERPPMPMPSASYPSTRVGRFGTGVDRVRVRGSAGAEVAPGIRKAILALLIILLPMAGPRPYSMRWLCHVLAALAAMMLASATAFARTGEVTLKVVGDERMAEELKT